MTHYTPSSPGPHPPASFVASLLGVGVLQREGERRWAMSMLAQHVNAHTVRGRHRCRKAFGRAQNLLKQSVPCCTAGSDAGCPVCLFLRDTEMMGLGTE